jgi:hypothetical protein
MSTRAFFAVQHIVQSADVAYHEERLENVAKPVPRPLARRSKAMYGMLPWRGEKIDTIQEDELEVDETRCTVCYILLEYFHVFSTVKQETISRIDIAIQVSLVQRANRWTLAVV